MVEQLAADYPQRFALLSMHVNDDGFDTTWAQHRLDVFYGIPAVVPTFMVDALWNCQSVGDYRYYVEQQLLQPTDTTLELTADPVGGSTWDVTARVCIESGPSRPVRIFTAATLDDHPELPRDATNILMQNPAETDVTLAGGDCANVTARVTFDPLSMANADDIVVIAWAQKPSPAAPTTVYQAALMRWPFPAGSQLATIEVTPADVTVPLGGEVVFTAVGRDQNGDPIPLDDPSWSLGGAGTGGGTFNPGSGSETTTFTATAVGTRQVFCTDGGVAGAAVVTVVEAPRLDSIVVEPATATVEVGGQVALSASGVDQYGDPIELADPTWSVTGSGGGTLDSVAGDATTFTASARGTVVVRCADGDVSGGASIEITGDAPHLATIVVSPAESGIRVGDELEFSATGLDQYGDPIALDDPEWRFEGTGDGSLDPASGSAVTTFTATGAGELQIICEDGGFEGAAAVEITERSTPKVRGSAGRRVVP